MKKILIIGGMHGNELLGVRLVESLTINPMQGVDVIIANPRAVARSERFTEADLNRSFGTTDQTYESRRAVELINVCKRYEIVLDFHNTQTANNNTSFVGITALDQLYKVAKILGLSTCIQADYDCINKTCNNVLSIEISVGDVLDSVDVWRDRLAKLLTLADSEIKEQPFEVYKLVRRVTWREKEMYGLSTWKPFKPLVDPELELFKLNGEVAPIFIGSRLTEYYASLVQKVGTR